MTIQRYGAYGTQAEPEGEFVTFADYNANAERLGEALAHSDAELAKWMARAAMEETQRKHAEAALTAERKRADKAEADKNSTKVAAWDKSAEVLAQNRDLRNQLGMALAERDELRERVARLVGAIEQIEQRTRPGGDMADLAVNELARTALEATT